MGEGRCNHRGRRIPRSHLYDVGEEPIYIGPGRPRRRGGALGGRRPSRKVPLPAALFVLLPGLLGIAAIGSLHDFIIYKIFAH